MLRRLIKIANNLDLLGMHREAEKATDSLKKLKKIGVVGIKQSFEDEGASFKDIETMRFITNAAKIHLNVKIGGCEAKNDIFFCIGKHSCPFKISAAPLQVDNYLLSDLFVLVGDNN
jgi:hypothetical protein